MNWFRWFLVGMYGTSIVLRLVKLNGGKPSSSGNLSTGVGMLLDAFLLAGIFLWL